MGRTNWTLELDTALAQSVDKLSRAGFNRLEKDPKRGGGDWCYRVGFWQAVASSIVVLCGLGTESPSPGACQARWWDVLDRLTDPNAPEPRIKVDPGMTEELKRYDAAWARCTVEVLERQEVALKAAYAALSVAGRALRELNQVFDRAENEFEALKETMVDSH